MNEEARFEFLPHTADARFRAYGRTLEEAAANAALAMVSLMWDYRQIEPRVKHQVEIRARNFEGLMVKFLTEILYLLEVKRFLLGRVEKIEIVRPEKTAVGEEDEYVLRAVLVGDDRPENYEIISEVKAATYNQFKLDEKPGQVQLEMVVDM